MKTEMRDTATLKMDPKNVRKHDNKNLEAIKGSLTQFGQQKPIVIDSKGYVIAGNGTLAAAKELGWKELSVTVSDLTATQLKAYALADNRTSDMSFFDDDLLKEALSALEILNFDIESIGFDLSDALMDLDFGNEEKKDLAKDKTFVLEVTFNSEEEMTDLYNEILGRGFICKAKLNG